jgi:uncharacterized protein (TIGR03083 family)
MTDISLLGPPIDVRALFAGQQAAFIDLLRGLDLTDWLRPTTCPGWNVKDVATHVLGDHLGRLSMLRDGFLRCVRVRTSRFRLSSTASTTSG